MSESPQDEWFYIKEGEKNGPVSLADLRVKAKEGGLNPRLDMVWRRGLADWKPAGEVEGLFNRRASSEVQETHTNAAAAAAAAAALAAAAAPYYPANGPEESLLGNTEEWPGTRRRGFFMAMIVFPIVWPYLVSLSRGFVAEQLGQEITKVILLGSAFVPMAVIILYGLSRLMNLGMSRWWFIGNFVPFLNMWIGYRCFACPPGYAYHKKLDRSGVALAILYWLMVVVSFLMMAAFFALLFGLAGDPALQEEMRKLLRVAQERAAKP